METELTTIQILDKITEIENKLIESQEILDNTIELLNELFKDLK